MLEAYPGPGAGVGLGTPESLHGPLTAAADGGRYNRRLEFDG